MKNQEDHIIAIKETIKSKYIRFLLLKGKEPISVLQFIDQINITESDFYDHYNSFKSIEKDVWKSLITDTIEILLNDSEYPSYSAREKSLAFFYTFIEILKQNRSLVLYRLEDFLPKRTIPFFLKGFFKEFKIFMNQVINEAIENQEIVDRPLVTEQYVHFYNLLIGYVLKVWISDSSKDYQVTDAAIEKSVNLSFDLLQKGPLDSIIDFAKFVYQNKAF